MSVQPLDRSPNTVLNQIDVIMDELLTLRQAVQTMLNASQVEPSPSNASRSALDIIDGAPGHRLFHTADDVSRYLHEERAAWDS